jgi:hypothetical protein
MCCVFAISLSVSVTNDTGYAIAQAVSHWLLTTDAQVQDQGSSCGMCGKQNGTKTGFL